jgi:DNA-binding SARP family transcriptional activator
VLRRYFRALLSAHPAALARDELADLLWPESEGDKAVRNLYDATKDLRRVLASIPGVQLRVSDQTYGLALTGNVRVS